jgi:hypothetical protein
MTAGCRHASVEGRRLGFKVSAHIYCHKDGVELAEAGVDNFAHLAAGRVR